MDSLLANYASSDDDGEAEEVSRAIPHPKISSFSNSLPPPKSSSFFSSLPPPRISNSSSPSSSSSLFASLPPPKSQLPNHSLNDYKREVDGGKPPNQPQSSSIFSSLPPPKTSTSSTFSSLPAPKSLSGNPSNKPSSDFKRVVHFTLPLNPSMLKSLDPDDDDEEEKGRKVRKDTSSSSTPKALSSMLPAPKNSLCIAPAQSFGASRKSSLQTDDPASRRSSLQTDDPSANCPQGSKTEHEVGSFASYSEYGAEQGMAVGYEACASFSAEQGVSDYENFKNDDGNWSSGVVNPAAVSSADATYASIPATVGWEQDNGDSSGHRSYMDSWSNASSGATTSEIPDIGRIAGKRGRTAIPTEIVEVKQDELMKNRPREDQIKSTGIAFGPAYQAAPSGKGKPSKLHKRKHQIGSLYYDLKQKEMELAERRSKGLLTKAETQAKYGW
ncbi:proline-rich receptor-like protein kinase PERK12 isoform X2 [Dendrobium catenatum]|uniref:proline-rich receptor-like protein kinase PERK12 isoform X2 n=1 Tax=Dendrobium catenatum TaxID=906689 RepID=UPI0009F27C81|nr:proline-rich receptor-like protein kinase PERK12 isoform X2 [Dendrobium catenatum]